MAVATGFIWCQSCDSSGTEPTVAAPENIISDSTMKLLQIDTAKLLPVSDEVKLSGEVSFDANRVVKVYPFSSGQVVSTNVSVGDHVKAGVVLATIKSADIAGNYSDLSVAGNEVSVAKRRMENAEHLYKNGIASEKEWLEAKENYNTALTAENKIRTQIQINGGGRTAANGTYVITAPRSGYVVEKLINPGDFIRNDNSGNLFTIGDISDVWIWANVYETDVAKVKEGYEAKITTLAYPDSVFTGKVDKINEVLDPVTKVEKIRVVLSNKGGALKPEMFANVLISNNGGKTAVVIPSTAVISENGKNYVVVYNNPNDVKVQEINILKTTKHHTYLTSGVEAGQRLITQNQILVYRKLMDR
jgi:cobalt-zinc-cadmium efflux system membrane fusion protein